MLGYTPEEMLGQTLFEFMPSDEAARVGEIIAAIAANKQPIVDLQSRNLAQDGREVVVLTNGVPILDDEGNQMGYRGVGKDITVRVRAETERERLLAAEHEQRTLAETLREVTLALTSQTSHAAVLDEILRQAQRIVPYSTANVALLQGNPLTDFAQHPERSEWTGHRALRIVCWQGYQDSPWIEWASNQVQPLADFVLDAEVIRSRQPLVISDTGQEPRWLALDEAAWLKSYLSLPICLRDRTLGLLRLDGATPGEFSAENAQRLQPLVSVAAIAIENAQLVEGLEDEVNARTAEIMAEKEKSKTILRNVDDDGRLYYDAIMTIAPMCDAAGRVTGYVSSHRDVSQRKALDRARDRFITNISHQLRTPVTNLKFYTHILRKGAPAEKTERYLQILDEQVNQLTHMVQDIVDMTIPDSGQALTDWGAVSLPIIIGDTITRYQRQASRFGLTLVAAPMPPDPSARFAKHPVRRFALDAGAKRSESPALRARLNSAKAAGPFGSGTGPALPAINGAQALGELAENAVVFTPAGGRVIVEAVSVEKDNRLWVTLTVPGTGLGLTIVKAIVEGHGGRVTVESFPHASVGEAKGGRAAFSPSGCRLSASSLFANTPLPRPTLLCSERIGKFVLP